MTERIKELLAMDETKLRREAAVAFKIERKHFTVVWSGNKCLWCDRESDSSECPAAPIVGHLEVWAFRARDMVEDTRIFGNAAWELSKITCPESTKDAQRTGHNLGFCEFVMGLIWLSSGEATPRHWLIAAIAAIEKGRAGTAEGAV